MTDDPRPTADLAALEGALYTAGFPVPQRRMSAQWYRDMAERLSLHLGARGFKLRAVSRPAAGEGLAVERLAQARLMLIGDIGAALSRELAQGNPFEPYDRIYVAKTVTRVLDAARDRVHIASGAALTADQGSREAGE